VFALQSVRAERYFGQLRENRVWRRLVIDEGKQKELADRAHVGLLAYIRASV